MPLFTTEGDFVLRSYHRSYAKQRFGRKADDVEVRSKFRSAWTPAEVAQLRKLAKGITPTRVIGLKLGRTPGAVHGKASGERIFAEAHEPVALQPPQTSLRR